MKKPKWIEEDRGYDTPCWIWQGEIDVNGYGRRWDRNAGWSRLAHNMLYTETYGPLPDGLEIDHLCRQRSCVRLDHLEAVTHRENILRGESPPAKRARQTHCKRGHPFDEANTYVATNGTRECRTCRRKQKKDFDQRRKAAAQLREIHA